VYDLKALGAKCATSIQAAVTQRLICRKEAKNNEKDKLDLKMNQKTTNITGYMHHRDKFEEKTYSQRQCYNGCFLYIRLPTMVHVSTVGVRN
jgi:hypothetical protein